MKKVLLGVSGTIGLTCIAFWFWFLPFVETRLHDLSNDPLASRGGSIKWDRIHWSLDGITLNNLYLTHPFLDAQVTQVKVMVDWMDWADGRPKIIEVFLDSPEIRLRLDAVTKDAAPSEDTSPLERNWPEIGPVHIRGGSITTEYRGKLIGGAESIEATATLVDHVVNIAGQGRTAGPGFISSDCALDAQFDWAEKHIRFDLTSAVEERSCIEYEQANSWVKTRSLQGIIGLSSRNLNLSATETELRIRGYRVRMNSLAYRSDTEGVTVHLAAPVVTSLREKRDTTVFPNAQVMDSAVPAVLGIRDWQTRLSRLSIPPRAAQWLSQKVTLSWHDAEIHVAGWPEARDGSGMASNGQFLSDWDLFGGTVKTDLRWQQPNDGFKSLTISVSSIDLPETVRAFETMKDHRSMSNFEPGGTMDLKLELAPTRKESPGGDGMRWSYELRIDDGRLFIPSVSEEPLTRINLLSRGKGHYSKKNESVTDDSTISMNGIKFSTHLTLDSLMSDPHLTFRLRSETLRCQDAVDALPDGLLGAYDHIALSGRIKPHLDFDWPLKNPEKLNLRFKGIIAPCTVKALKTRLSDAPLVHVNSRRPKRRQGVSWLNERFKIKVREGTSKRKQILVGPGTEDYVEYHQLPAYVGAAAYLTEEILFPRNRALDPGLIRRALRMNLKQGRFVYGGSTVTQQLVKNLFLTRKKTLARKIQEILIAKRITHSVSRDRVLALYLNCIEFGPDIFGIGPAAWYYFQKPASDLSPREAVFLAMIKPKPRNGVHMMRRGHSFRSRYWISRTEEIFRRLVDKGFLTQEEADAERPYELQWKDGVYQRRTTAPSPTSLNAP